jgi:hypothetical protein
MQTPFKLGLMVLALAASASLTLAQDDSSTPPVHRQHPPEQGSGHSAGRQRPHGLPVVAALDANRDGVIDAVELAKAPEALLSLDKNGDGTLDSSELVQGLRHAPARPHAPPPPPAHAPVDGSGVGSADEAIPAPPPPPHAPRVPPVLAALDVNQDGVIDAGEIANATTALKTLDRNGDGQLTPEECGPAVPAHVRAHPGQRGPGPVRHAPPTN